MLGSARPMKKRDLAGSESLTSASFFQNGVAAVASSFHDEEDSQGQLIEKTQKTYFQTTNHQREKCYFHKIIVKYSCLQ